MLGASNGKTARLQNASMCFLLNTSASSRLGFINLSFSGKESLKLHRLDRNINTIYTINQKSVERREQMHGAAFPLKQRRAFDVMYLTVIPRILL